MENETTIERCFIITPIGDENSPVRRKTDGLLNNVIKPICCELKYKAVPAHEIDNSGSITNQVINDILNSKMVIANLTGLNPNVMYELAIRHASKLPVVCIAEHGTNLPFDITTERTIFYKDDMAGAEQLKNELKKKIAAAIDDDKIDNPIYRAIKEDKIIKDLKINNPQESSALFYIVSKLDRIEQTLNLKLIDEDDDETPYKPNYTVKYLFEEKDLFDQNMFFRKIVNFVDSCDCMHINNDNNNIIITFNNEVTKAQIKQIYDYINKLPEVNLLSAFIYNNDKQWAKVVLT